MIGIKQSAIVLITAREWEVSLTAESTNCGQGAAADYGGNAPLSIQWVSNYAIFTMRCERLPFYQKISRSKRKFSHTKDIVYLKFVCALGFHILAIHF